MTKRYLRANPEERLSDRPILLSTCEAELGEVSGHEREQQQTRRQLLIPSPLQAKEEILRNTSGCCWDPATGSIEPHRQEVNVVVVGPKGPSTLPRL